MVGRYPVQPEQGPASDEHMQRFRDSGGDLWRYLTRKRKVDGQVVQAVEQKLRGDAGLSLAGLAEGVNRRLGREDLTGANMACALDQLSGRVVRGIYMKQVERGAVHYKKPYVIEQIFDLSPCAGSNGGESALRPQQARADGEVTAARPVGAATRRAHVLGEAAEVAFRPRDA